MQKLSPLLVAGALAVGMGTASATCQTGEKVLRFGISKTATDTKSSRLAKEVQTQFQRALNGRVCVEIIQDAGITISGEELEALREKRADIVAVSFDTLSVRSSRYKLFGLPFAFSDRFALNRYLASLPKDYWAGAVGAFGLKSFGVALFGLEQLGAKKSVFQPTDAVGLKFRQKDQNPTRDVLSLMKSSGQRIEDKDVAAAVKDGRVEAQFADWHSLRASGSADNHAVIVETNFSVRGAQALGTTLWFETLDTKLGKEISAAISEGVSQFNRRELQRIREAKRALLQSGKTVHALTRKQRARWRELFAPLWEEFRKTDGGASQLKAVEKANR